MRRTLTVCFHRVAMPRRALYTAPRTNWVRRPLAAPLAPGAFACAALLHPLRRQSSAPDHYATLGVRPDATPDEIKSAYKKLALTYHPDRNHDPGAEEKFKSISSAYNVIGNKQKRREYDAQRSMFAAGGGGGGAQHPGFHGTAGGGGNPFAQGSRGYQHMSKDEADRLFREIFGGMRVDQIFRDLEEEMRRGGMRSGSGLGSSVGDSFARDQQTFRPFFSGGASTVFTDRHGNRFEEQTFTDPRGTRFTVRRRTSGDPNASVNETTEEFFRAHTSRSDGRFHFGNVSRATSTPNRDFTQQFLGVRSHGRSVAVSMLTLLAWTIVLGTILYAFITLVTHHPYFCLAIVFLIWAGRYRRF